VNVDAIAAYRWICGWSWLAWSKDRQPTAAAC